MPANVIPLHYQRASVRRMSGASARRTANDLGCHAGKIGEDRVGKISIAISISISMIVTALMYLFIVSH